MVVGAPPCGRPTTYPKNGQARGSRTGGTGSAPTDGIDKSNKMGKNHDRHNNVTLQDSLEIRRRRACHAVA